MNAPITYTLCGSTQLPDAFAVAAMHLTARGHIVIGLGMYRGADEPRGAYFLTGVSGEKYLGAMHRRKIDASDAIYVVNVGGYVGDSTREEIRYALGAGRRVDWMFPDAIPAEFEVRR